MVIQKLRQYTTFSSISQAFEPFRGDSKEQERRPAIASASFRVQSRRTAGVNLTC